MSEFLSTHRADIAAIFILILAGFVCLVDFIWAAAVS